MLQAPIYSADPAHAILSIILIRFPEIKMVSDEDKITENEVIQNGTQFKRNNRKIKFEKNTMDENELKKALKFPI